MRWFKHMADSHTDERLALVQAELGLEGYGFYWLTLETIAKQMDANSDRTSVEYPVKIWQKIYGFSPKKLRKFVGFFADSQIFTADFSGNSLTIDCPKLLKYRDEWSRKKRKNFGVTPERLRSKDTDTDTELDNKTPLTPLPGETADVAGEEPPEEKPRPTPKPKYSPSFEAWWKAYPKKVGKDAAYRSWKKIGKRGDVSAADLIKAVEAQVAAEHFRGRDGQDFVPNPATWLNQGRWADEIASAYGGGGLPEAEDAGLTPEEFDAMFSADREVP